MKKIILLAFLMLSSAGISQTNLQKIKTYFQNSTNKSALKSQDLSDLFIENEAYGEGTKITSCYIVQRFNGIEIFNSQSNVAFKDGKIINASNRFISNISQKAKVTIPKLSVTEALKAAYLQLGITSNNNFAIVGNIDNKRFILNNNIPDDQINAKLVYLPSKDNTLQLAWSLQFYSPDSKNLWSIRLDAITGKIIEKDDLTVHCSFDKKQNQNYIYSNLNYEGIVKEKSNYKIFTSKNSSVLKATASGTYKVIPFNFESPKHSPFQLISAPENATASPNGWHNANTIAGTSPSFIYTITRGNNVLARDDVNNNDGFFTPLGVSPSGGATLNFDFPYGGVSAQPQDYRPAATTNVFYMANILHDIWYQYGFNEASGNFQQNNLGRGGNVTTNGDAVQADAQDGGGLNNANFATPIDGFKPRMQMYLWNSNNNPEPLNFINVNSPPTFAGPQIAVDNNFYSTTFGSDKVVIPSFPAGITADLALYKNNPTPPGYNSACQAPTNLTELIDKIVLVRRGKCSFNFKVKNAQDAGAKAVIVMDSIPNNARFAMRSSTNELIGITVPAVFVTKEQGDAFIANMVNGPVNVTIQTPSGAYLFADGDFDNGIIAHEYAHGISTRLTGGAANSDCLRSPEQMGEGWSDWVALMMQIKPGDTGIEPRGIGTYAINDPITGLGIRNFPYSTNMTINPLTFKYTNGNEPLFPVTFTRSGIERVEVHQTGEIWAATLWDLTWSYINKYGYDTNIYTGVGGNNKIMQLVLDAMKLQPCNPSYIEARDAIIAADQATTGGKDYCMIWKVFARRGLGINASSGDNSGDWLNLPAIHDQVEDFTEPVAGPNCTSLAVDNFNIEKNIKIYPNPAPKGLFNIQVEQYSGDLDIQIFDLTGRSVYSLKEVNFNNQKTINLNQLQKGVYIIKLKNETINYTEKIIIK